MCAAKKRLQQISNHIREARPATSKGEPDVICTTREYTPGNNVTIITFSNPTKLNIASKELLNKLTQICGDLSKDNVLRVVVLTGAPPASPGKPTAFIGGADLHELNALNSSDDARKYVAPLRNACAALQELPVPIIARVHGFSLGAGLELMISCDLRIATKTSLFGMPEARIGLPSMIDAALLPSFIGLGRTRRLLYLAEQFPASTAEQWGLIERVVDDETALDQAVAEWVATIVHMGPQSMRDQKELMRKWQNSNLKDAIDAGAEALADSFADGGIQAKEFMKPFLGRRR